MSNPPEVEESGKLKPPEPEVQVLPAQVPLRPRYGARYVTPLTETQIATGQQRARGWRI